MAKFCPECAHPIIDSKSQFCPKCGVKFPIICPGCAHPIMVDNSQFCPKCGTRLPVTSPEVQPPAARPTTVQQPSYPTYTPPLNSGPSSSQTPAPQQQNSITDSLTKKRSAGEWIAICCGGIILLVIVSALLTGMSDGIRSSTSKDVISTQDLGSMALTINDMPTGWRTERSPVIGADTYSCKFDRVVGLTVYFVYLDIFKYPTVESAKTAYQSDKAKITKYKVESVSLGNEGYGYVDNQASNVVFRKGNIIVKTLYSESSIGGFSPYISISDSKNYAKIVADRIN